MAEKWKYTASKNGRHQISTEHGAQVCMLWNCDKTIDRAHLIAAAPEMRIEIEQLKQEIEKLKSQRDDAYANRDLHQKLLQEKIEVTNELCEALEEFIEMYVRMINSGDCGNWNPEEDKEVITGRAVLAKARGDNKKRTPESAKAYLIKSNKNELMHRTVFEIDGLYYSFFGYGRSAQEIWDAVKDSISNDTPLGLIKSEIDELNQNYLGEVK